MSRRPLRTGTTASSTAATSGDTAARAGREIARGVLSELLAADGHSSSVAEELQ